MEPDQSFHTEATMLSGYVSRTLSKDEHHQVEQHLQTCSACRQELQEITAMKTALKTAIHQRPGPSPAAFAKVMSRIHQETQPRPSEITLGPNLSWWERIEQGVRSLFEVRWAPALAVFLIVGQTVLLLSVVGGPGGQGSIRNGPIYERGIPQGTPAIPTLTVEVQFVETAQEGQIRSLVRDLGGRIIDGPTADGRYTVEFPASPGTSADSILKVLRKRPELVQRAQSLGS